MYSIVDPLGKVIGQWSYSFNIWSIILRLLLAVLLGTIIGIERSNNRHSAGLRTFILVCFISTIVMIIDYSFLKDQTGLFLLSAAVIIGVAIIGANALLYSSKSQIKGLTTSVALLGSAALGLTIGACLYSVALIEITCLIIVLSVFPALETYLKNRSNHFEIHLELKKAANLTDFQSTLRQLGLKVDDIEANPAYHNSGLAVYSVSLTVVGEELKKYKTHDEIIKALSSIEYVNHIEEMN